MPGTNIIYFIYLSRYNKKRIKYQLNNKNKNKNKNKNNFIYKTLLKIENFIAKNLLDHIFR
jgi:hypothetical protein